MLNQVLKYGRIQLVHDLLAVALGENEPSIAQRAEVTGDGSPGGREVLGDLAGALGPIAEEAEDLAAGGIREGTEGVHARIYYILS
jgi:hypothetical protein